MSIVLSPEQVSDADFLSCGDGCLFSEPGTGKTFTALAARREVKPASSLMVVPRIAQTQWQREAVKMGLEPPVVCRSGPSLLLALREEQPHIITTPRLMTVASEALRSWGPQVLILDESHVYVSQDAQRTQAVYGARCRGGEDSLMFHTELAWLLTGTPQLRYPDDLWPMLRGLFPDVLKELLGSRWNQIKAFESRYCIREKGFLSVRKRDGSTVQIETDNVVGSKNEDELKHILYHAAQPYAVRRLLVDVDKHLPPRRERDIDIGAVEDELLDKQFTAAREIFHLFDEAYADPDSLSPVIANLRRLFGEAKLPGAIEYLQEIDEPVVVFTWHREVAAGLAEKFVNSKIIQGGTPEKQATQTVADFAAGRLPMLIGQIASMGTALDGLQESCKRVVFVERIGSPALMEQAVRRVWRRGQRQSVQIEYIRADHDLEHITDMTLASKAASQERTIG